MERSAHNGVDCAALASLLCREYDVDHDTALADVDRILLAWKEAGIIVG